MDIKETAELTAFRKSVREWVQANLPGDINQPFNYRGRESDEKIDAWFDVLAKKNWLTFRWPQEFGGAGFSEPEQIVYLDELQNCGAPIPRGFGISMVGPLLLQFGESWQKERFLPKIAANTEKWCQGYSEPGAGSDLAGLQTRAEIDGDDFIVNGQKIWTSRANEADWIFALVRTDPDVKKQAGISFLLIDMTTPGVSIRPIDQIDGRASFYETFFDNVRVPRKNLVGEINQGWTMAKALLGHERVSTGADVNLPALVKKIRALATQYESQGKLVLENVAFRDKLVRLEMDADCLRYTRYRLMTAVMQGRAPGPESSIFKMFQTELVQDIHDLGMDAMGPDGMCWYDENLSEEAYDMPMFANINRAMSIYSGSNEVQRNIISKRVLGLPD